MALRDTFAGFFYPRQTMSGPSEVEGQLVRMANITGESGRVRGGLNPIVNSPFFIAYKTRTIRAARKMMGLTGTAGSSQGYDGTADQLNPLSPYCMDRFDPVSDGPAFTVMPNALPSVNKTTQGAGYSTTP